MNACPLCRCSKVHLVETIDGRVVNEGWQRAFGIEGPLYAERLHYLACGQCGLRFFDPMEAGAPDLYASLQEFDWYYLTHKPEFDVALRHLSGATSVLEVGAGAGAFAGHLGDRRYVGLETSSRAVATARAAGIELLTDDITDHAAAGHRYDAVAAFQVLEHVPDPRSFLLGCIECLSPGGRLVIAVPTMDGFMGSAVNDWLNLPPHHVSHWSRQVFESVADQFGLRLSAFETEPVASFHDAWAAEVLRARRLRALIRLQHRLVDTRLRARVVAKVARAWPGPPRRAHSPKVRGHTCIAVLQKDSPNHTEAAPDPDRR